MASALVGRTREVDELSALAQSVRAGSGRTVVLLGEPGVGKSALLELAADIGGREAGLRVLRLAGAKGEQPMAYGLLDRLAVELGGESGPAQWGLTGADDASFIERRTLCENVLRTVLACARDSGMLLLVDDVHLVDQQSQEVLAYVRRRIFGSAVGVVLAGDDLPVPDADDRLLQVRPLARDEASQLFSSSCARTFDQVTVNHILDVAAGNPAAVRDLAEHLGSSRLRHDQLALEPPPLATSVTTAWLRGCESLSEDARTWLLLAASEGTRQLRTIEAAARTVGLPRETCLEVEDAGVVELRDRVVFAHPLVATSVIATSTAPRRRTVHHALARAAENERSPVRAAWHLARATLVPDDESSEQLASASARFDHGMTYLNRATLLARSAELTSDEGLRSARLLGAAAYARLAGAELMAEELASAVPGNESANPLPDSPAAEIGGSQHLHEELGHLDLHARAQVTPARARQDATRSVVQAFRAWRSAPFSEAKPQMEEALEGLFDADDDTTLHLYPYGVLLASALWDASSVHRLLRSAQQVADLREAAGVRTTVRDLTRAVNIAVGRSPVTHLDPIAPIASVPADGSTPIAEKWSGHVRIVGLVAASRYREVLDVTAGLTDTLPGRAGQLLPEMIEAGAHLGDGEVVREALRSYEQISRGCPTPWTRGLLARSRALTSAIGAEDLFLEGIAELSTIDASSQLARTRLLYGEWLRRNRRRREAGDQLREAHALFTEVAHPLLGRTVRELSLAGASVHGGGVQRLTAQELAVARLAASGARNAEIAERLFISRHTVDYHLRKVYRKLGIESRRSLPRAISNF